MLIFRKGMGWVMMGRFVLSVILVLTFILTGCGEADIKGIVIETTDNYLLISQNLTTEEYETIKHKSPTELQKDDVAGEGPHLSLIDIIYEQAADFASGDYVEVWLKGDIRESYPAQADAKKVKKVK